MTGFINRLFRPKAVDNATESKPVAPKPQPAPSQPSQSQRSQPQRPVKPKVNSASGEFFLDNDTAKSLGNVEYMRTAKTVKHKFPKTAGSKEELKIVKQVSALEEKAVVGEVTAPQAGQSQPEEKSGDKSVAQSASQVASQRRQADTSMDMFRNMARDLKK